MKKLRANSTLTLTATVLAAVLVVANCFAIWAPGKKQQARAIVSSRPGRTALRYEEVATYIEIEGARKKDRILVSQRRLEGS